MMIVASTICLLNSVPSTSLRAGSPDLNHYPPHFPSAQAAGAKLGRPCGSGLGRSSTVMRTFAIFLQQFFQGVLGAALMRRA